MNQRPDGSIQTRQLEGNDSDRRPRETRSDERPLALHHADSDVKKLKCYWDRRPATERERRRSRGECMGYFVAAHVVRSAPAAESFDVLPASMDWAAYHEPATGAILIDVFGSSVDRSSPFARLPRSPDIAQDLPDTLALYEALLAQRRAGPFRRKYINLNLLFSRATDMSVLSFASDDDDGLDLACLSFAGQLHRLRFKADALEIIWTEGHGVTQPLVRDDDHAASEAELLVLKSLSEFKILAPEERSSVLHRNCTRRVQSVSPYRNVHSGDGHLGRVRPYRSRLHAR